MKTISPDYYKDFKCIAHKCRHTCCAHWEIDIDEVTLKKYEAMEGSLGVKLKNNIVFDECPHFIFKEDERCPFLNENNLCEIILEKGDSYLSQVCSDHPRFRSYFSDRVEIGLGLCCEEAARLILSNRKKVELTELSDDGKNEELSEEEEFILGARNLAFEIAEDESLPLEERLEELLATFKTELPQKSPHQWAEYFFSLARLDELWDERLNKLKSFDGSKDTELSKFDMPFQQLLTYFLYRHIPLAEGTEDVRTQVAFSVLSLEIIRELFKISIGEGKESLEELGEIARLYSSEIEYSEINTDNILNMLWDYIN